MCVEGHAIGGFRIGNNLSAENPWIDLKSTISVS